MGVLVAVQEGYVGEEMTALLRLAGLWGEEVLSYPADGDPQRRRERACTWDFGPGSKSHFTTIESGPPIFIVVNLVTFFYCFHK